MRIIAGQRRGTVLHSFDIPSIRPTKDIVKEFIFNCLANLLDISQTSVWDLYAGSGALGLEALSRGARFALFVENHPKAVELIHRNIAKTKFEKQTSVCRCDVESFFEQAHEPVSLILADPPYGLCAGNFLIENLGSRGYLASSAIFVLESSPNEEIMPYDGWSLYKKRKWGESQVHILQFKG